MIHLRNITKTYNDKLALDKVDLTVNSGEVIALIGDNGAGKTTLLKILLSEVAPDEGVVEINDIVVGYVPQEAVNQDKSINQSFGKQEPWRIDYALGLVGLEGSEFKKVKQLSGGQKTRLAIAQVLIQDPQPSVLLLDEPTNNIDSDGLNWLEQFIKNFSGAILLVSHDRHFINMTANVVIELKDAKLLRYGGDYDFYKLQKEIEYQAELKKYEQSVEKRQQLERVLREKQDRARKGIRNQKKRDNDKAQFDWHQNNVQRSFGSQSRAMQTRLDQLDDLTKPESSRNYKLKLSSRPAHFKKLIEAKSIGKKFGTNVVFTETSLLIRGGERWHVSGLNGSGKSTLLSILSGTILPDYGEIKRAENVSIGYYSQELKSFSKDISGLDSLSSTPATKTEIIRCAASMGLSFKDLAKKFSELSRGQQAKLAFIELLLANHDVIILDEPTNHLDIATKERLETALNDYQGALVVASHDKYFIDMIKLNKKLVLTIPNK